MANGMWEFKGWIRVPGDSNNEPAARQAAEELIGIGASHEGSIAIEDSEPTFEETKPQPETSAPVKPSALEQTAYDLLHGRIVEGIDPEDEPEWVSYPPEVRESYLRHQAKLLAEVWQLTADNFSPDSIAFWSEHHEPNEESS